MRTKFQFNRFLLLDWYLLAEVFQVFLGTFVFIIFIFLMFQMFRLAEFFIMHGTSFLVLLEMSGYMFIAFLPNALPVAFLMSIMIGFGRLSADHELIAFIASGVSLNRMSAPLYVLALLFTFVLYLLTSTWVPWSEHQSKKLYIKIANTEVTNTVKAGSFTNNFFNLLIYVGGKSEENNQLFDVFIYDERASKQPMVYVAKNASIHTVNTSQDVSAAIVLELYNGSIHHQDMTTQTVEKINFDRYRLFLKLNLREENIKKKPRMIPRHTLTQLLKRTTPDTEEGRDYRCEYHRRVAIALTPILFVFFGVQYGSFFARHIKSGSIMICFMVLVIYWFTQSLGVSWVSKGKINPFIAMELPNFFIFLIASFRFLTNKL
jgi:lipopolysaccharide export system permease protein